MENSNTNEEPAIATAVGTISNDGLYENHEGLNNNTTTAFDPVARRIYDEAD